MSSKYYEVFVPTYKRAKPAILKMLQKDKNLTLNFCVRHEEMNFPAYKFIKNKYKDRVNFIDLGKGIKDIGETRRRIMNYAYSHYLPYCVMIDDGITNFFYQLNGTMTISECLELAIRELDKRQVAIACTFRRQEDKFVGVSSEDTTCCGIMQQAYVISVYRAFSHDISFKSLKKVGFEDAAFMLDAFKAGLYTISVPFLFMEGKAPNVIQKGGNHVDTDVAKFAKSYDKKSKQLSKYIGQMYGVSFEKKFRNRYQAQVTYCIVNYAYFREVLVENRRNNANLINSKFKM